MNANRESRPTDAMAAEAIYAGEASVDRSAFLTRVYLHLLAAIGLFVLLEVWLFRAGYAESIARALLGVNWMLVLGGFMVAGWLARGLAGGAGGRGVQYAGLALYVAAQAIIFCPILFIAKYQVGDGVIESAGLLTALGFTGLTVIALQTRKDFTFLGGMLRWGGILALVAIAGGVFFGWNLGMWFSVAMIGLAGAAILHDTSKILYTWHEDRYVGAALELFASVALMFWYILRLLMARR